MTETNEVAFGRLQPGRLWSLWDMYDFVLREFHETIQVVAKAHQSTQSPEVALQAGFIGADYTKVLLPEFERVRELCARIELEHATHRTEWLLKRLREGAMTWPHLRSDTASIHEGIISDAQKIFCYHYPPKKAEALVTIEAVWGKVFTAFKSAAPEIRAGVDLYALGHNTASVFHMMRAVEVALRALARERKVKLPKKKPIDSGQWQEIITALNAQIREIGIKWKMGPRKEAALAFYSGALGHMTAFKDKYRNQVSHSTRTYDEHEAASAILHVREFMAGLAERMTEDSKSIAWGR